MTTPTPEQENESIFRQEALDKASSPDQLNDYIKLSNPGLWFVLIAILVLLAGACIFGAVGTIDSTVPGVGIAKDGKMTLLVKREYADRFTNAMKVKISGQEYEVSLNEAKPVTVSDETDPYALFLGELQAGDWVYEMEVQAPAGTFSAGAYEARLVTEKISPLSFLLGKQ